MQLKPLESTEFPHAGYGAGEGRIIKEEYECPCGKGTVTYEKDDIPGFRESSIDCYCSECDQLYNFGRGIATKK